MEIAGFVVAVVASLVAVASAWFALGANRRADTADTRATEAVDLQRRIDEREREFRSVSWHGAWEAPTEPDAVPLFQLTNTGLTDASGVTLVLEMPRGAQAYNLGDLPHGDHRTAPLHTNMRGPAAPAVLELHGLQYEVHWSGPLGQVDRYQHAGHQIF